MGPQLIVEERQRKGKKWGRSEGRDRVPAPWNILLLLPKKLFPHKFPWPASPLSVIPVSTQHHRLRVSFPDFLPEGANTLARMYAYAQSLSILHPCFVCFMGPRDLKSFQLDVYLLPVSLHYNISSRRYYISSISTSAWSVVSALQVSIEWVNGEKETGKKVVYPFSPMPYLINFKM